MDDQTKQYEQDCLNKWGDGDARGSGNRIWCKGVTGHGYGDFAIPTDYSAGNEDCCGLSYIWKFKQS